MEHKHVEKMGHEGFIWWFGKIENVVDDPLKIGRVRVRIFNTHSDDISLVPSTTLPWAHVSQDITSAANAGIGRSPTGLMIGSLVWGFFLDGVHSQQPVVAGVIAGAPGGVSDISKLAQGTNTISRTSAQGEPASPYAAKYPYNNVTTTQSGHVIEIDDTPGAERIHIYHKSGSYEEIGPDGTRVVKNVAGAYDITVSNKTVDIGGDLNVNITGTCNVTMGSGNINSNGKLIVKGSTVNIESDGLLALTGSTVTANGKVIS